MAIESKKNQDDQAEELYTWIATIPFSKPKKNLTRDFSDAVLMAEVLKVYYPRYVDLHNYVSANNVNTKKDNWNMLNRKVLTKIDMKLTKETINQLATSHPGAAEHLLLELKAKILKDTEQIKDSLCNSKGDELIEQGKLYQNDVKTDDVVDVSLESCPIHETILQTINPNVSTFVSVKQQIMLIVSWLLNWLCIWNHIPIFRKIWLSKTSSKHSKEKERTDALTEQIRSVKKEVENIPRHVCAQLRQEVREKDDIICTLNHKIAYLESSMKLKDLRISNLTSQILQNAVESDQMVKMQTNGVQIKPRVRAQTVRDKIKVEE